ncbi:MAG: hypothetical protein ACREDH_15540 [Methylocella sp.]
MSTPDIKLDINTPIPGSGGPSGAGYLIGRTRGGTGPAHLISLDEISQLTAQRGANGSSGIGSSGAANPTATASDTAVNGSATTFLRSDGAPAIQKASSSQFGIVKVDGSSITESGGVISTSAGSRFSAVPTQAGTGFSSFLHTGGNSTKADKPNGIVVSTSNTGDLIMVDLTTVPSTPYAFDLNLLAVAQGSGYIGYGLVGWSDGTKYLLLRMLQLYGETQILVDTWNAYNSHGSIVYGGNYTHPCGQSEWLRIHDDGTNLNFYSSPDGAAFALIYQQGRTSYLSSPSHVVFGGRNEGADVSAVLRSWARSI